MSMKRKAEVQTKVGDFKQLPPATTQPPFICLRSVYTTLDFRVLRENRRVRLGEARAAESNDFHAALGDIAWGCTTERVKKLVIEAYVRGARVGCAEKAALERFTQGLAIEVYDNGISVTSLAPSQVVATPGTVFHNLVTGMDDPLSESPELMAKAALLLASEPLDLVTGRVTYSQQILMEFGWLTEGKGRGVEADRPGTGFSQI